MEIHLIVDLESIPENTHLQSSQFPWSVEIPKSLSHLGVPNPWLPQAVNKKILQIK